MPAWHEFVQYDIMHVGAGLVKDTFLGTLQGSRWGEKVVEIEGTGAENAGKRFSAAQMVDGPGYLPPAAWVEFEDALKRVAVGLGGDFARLERVLDVSKKPKSHTLFLLAGPAGLYALAHVRRSLTPEVYDTLVHLLQAIHLLWSKEIHIHALPTLQAFVYEAVCAVELFLPVSERDIKLHELTEMAIQIRAWGEFKQKDQSLRQSMLCKLHLHDE
jgi:hypothetical protein